MECRQAGIKWNDGEEAATPGKSTPYPARLQNSRAQTRLGLFQGISRHYY
jgi:hypothetical protein